MKNKSLLLLGLMCSLLIACQGANPSNPTSSSVSYPEIPEITRTYEKIASDTLFTQKVENMPDDFIIGMDASAVPSLEESGVRYYNFDGQEEDVFKILSDNGVNYIRVRIWNDPFDSKGRGYGGGNNDILRAIEIGKRATKYNMKLLVNFHYSDFWADPAKQQAPKAWDGMDIATKGDALYQYTYDCLDLLKQNGVNVGMVQVGNETSGGKMAGETRFSFFVSLFNRGAEAVRKVYPEALVAVHFANPEKTANYLDWASKMNQYNADYDVFGSSYYPYWHGTLENLSYVLSEIATTYDKKTMVLETSYAYTTDDTDFHTNTIGTAGGIAKPYPMTIAGQANCFRDVVDTIVNKTTNGIGVCYWEGTWISVGTNSWEENSAKWEKYGSGWAASYAGEYDKDDAGQWYGGCACDNQAFFDATGHPLESLKVLNNVRFGNDAPRYVDGINDVTVQHYTYENFTLPETVDVIFNDNTRSPLPVTWEDFDIEAAKAKGNGEYTIKGKAEGYDGDVYCYLTILEYNFIENYSFETGKADPWTVTNLNTNVPFADANYKVKPTAENPKTGTYAFHFWAQDADVINFEVEQKINIEKDGTYKYQASILGGKESSESLKANQNNYIYVKINGEIVAKADLNFTSYNGGYQNALISAVECKVGQDVIVGFHIESHNEAGVWGDVDDAMFNIVL